jgi:dihydrofolate reductase
MIVSAIAAISENYAIGKDNDLIWNLPKDMRFFRDTTLGHHVIMGRMNFDSIPHKWRPLKGRPNIVVTRQLNYQAEGATVVNTIKDGIEISRKAGEDETFIIGGGQIYKRALEAGLLDKMYITHVHGTFDADVFYPKFDTAKWTKKIIGEYPVDDSHAYSFTICEYTRLLPKELV